MFPGLDLCTVSICTIVHRSRTRYLTGMVGSGLFSTTACCMYSRSSSVCVVSKNIPRRRFATLHKVCPRIISTPRSALIAKSRRPETASPTSPTPHNARWPLPKAQTYRALWRKENLTGPYRTTRRAKTTGPSRNKYNTTSSIIL